MGCYSLESPADPVCLSVVEGTVPVGNNEIYDQKKLLGLSFYWLNKNPGGFMLQ